MPEATRTETASVLPAGADAPSAFGARRTGPRGGGSLHRLQRCYGRGVPETRQRRRATSCAGAGPAHQSETPPPTVRRHSSRLYTPLRTDTTCDPEDRRARLRPRSLRTRARGPAAPRPPQPARRRPDRRRRPRATGGALRRVLRPPGRPRRGRRLPGRLWLRFNYLDESHKISQDVETPEGSFWHGILHRREGDFDNAKYWFRRVGTHPVFASLCRAAAELAAAAPEARAAFLAGQKIWDPFAFVDLCAAAVRGQAKCLALCEDVQRREWELLFDYCWRKATRAPS